MKRALGILGVIAVAALIVYLTVTRYLAQERAAKLDRALMDAQAQVIQLEADKEAANQRLAELMRAQPAPTPAAGAPGTAPATAPAAAQPAAGSLVRYVAFSQAGLTNLVRIEGTSSVHDWQVEGHLLGGSAELGAGLSLPPGTQASPGPVEAEVSVFIPVRSLKSVEKDGRRYSDAMDEIMCGKLLEPANKRISYTLTSLALKEQPRGASDPFSVRGHRQPMRGGGNERDHYARQRVAGRARLYKACGFGEGEDDRLPDRAALAQPWRRVHQDWRRGDPKVCLVGEARWGRADGEMNVGSGSWANRWSRPHPRSK